MGVLNKKKEKKVRGVEWINEGVFYQRVSAYLYALITAPCARAGQGVTLGNIQCIFVINNA